MRTSSYQIRKILRATGILLSESSRPPMPPHSFGAHDWLVRHHPEENTMLYWALVFLVVALIAGVLGFTGIAVAAAGIAKLLFVVFLVLFLISLIAHLGRDAGQFDVSIEALAALRHA